MAEPLYIERETKDRSVSLHSVTLKIGKVTLELSLWEAKRIRTVLTEELR